MGTDDRVTVQTLQAFAEAFDRHDTDAVMAFTFAGGRIRVKDSYRKIRTPPG